MSRGLVGRGFGLVRLLAGPSSGISIRTSFQGHRLSTQSSFCKAERADGGERARYGHGSAVQAMVAQPLLMRQMLGTTERY